MSADRRTDLARLQRWCFIVAGAAAIVCAVGALVNVQAFFRSYLFAWLGWLGIPLGSLMILLVHQLTGGRWGRALQPVLQATTSTLPLFALLFLLVALGMRSLYIWSDADRVAADEVLRQKQAYLNVPRFLIFAGIYFAVWIGIGWRLSQLHSRWVETRDEGTADKARRLSAVGLVLMGLTISFAAMDWVMSLEPHWYSSIFGMLFGTAVVLPAYAFGILVLAWRNREPAAGVVQPDTWNDLGNLLLAVVMIWAYMAYSQFFLIWSGNLPEEITWYMQRGEGIWRWLSVAMILFYFLLPFMLLLVRDLKRDPRRLGIVATLIVGMHFVHHYWLVKPAFLGHHASGHASFFEGMHWLDPLAFLAVGGLWGAVFINRLQRAHFEEEGNNAEGGAPDGH